MTLELPEVKPIGEYIDSLGTILSERGETPELSIVSMPDVNSKIWGIKKRKLTLIAARTSHGKSSFSCQIAYDFASQGHKVLFLSLEMSVEDILERLFCYIHRISNEALLTGKFKDYGRAWGSFMSEMDTLPLVVSDFMGKSWEQIDDYLDSLTDMPDVVILDYIQTIAKKSTFLKDDIDEYVRRFREMAIRHDYAGIICSQINRGSEEGKSKVPQNHQIKSSGFLEEHSDVILILYWPHKHDSSVDKTEYHIVISKNRSGRTGMVKLRFYPEHYRFADFNYDPKHQEVIDEFNK